MNKTDYSPIITKTTKQTFFNYINLLNIPLIDYVAIGVQNQISKKSISLMSLPEWQQHFVQNQYANYDPLRKVTLNTKRNFIPFQEIDFGDNFGKEIMGKRAMMGIKNGIILMKRFEKYSYMITLGTGFMKFEAYDFIKQHHDKVNLIQKDLIALIGKDARTFLSELFLKPSIHPSIDAI